MLQNFMTEVAAGMKRNFAVDTVSFLGILENCQRTYLNELIHQRTEELKSIIEVAETWQTVKIKESEQRLVDQINTLEYEELAPVGDELSDCLQSGRAEGERT